MREVFNEVTGLEQVYTLVNVVLLLLGVLVVGVVVVLVQQGSMIRKLNRLIDRKDS